MGFKFAQPWKLGSSIEGLGVAPPANTVAPAITGTLTQGSLLSVTTGTWTGSPTYAYQWTRNGVDIGGATSSTYTLVQADTARDINCRVTATNAGGSTPKTATAVTVPAPELVSNGAFTTDTVGWTPRAGAPTFVSTSGEGVLTNTTAAFGYAFQLVSGLEVGVVYTFTVTSTALLGVVNLGTSEAGGQYRTDLNISNTTYTIDVTTTSSSFYIALKIASNTIAASTKFDNVSLKKKP